MKKMISFLMFLVTAWVVIGCAHKNTNMPSSPSAATTSPIDASVTQKHSGDYKGEVK